MDKVVVKVDLEFESHTDQSLILILKTSGWPEDTASFNTAACECLPPGGMGQCLSERVAGKPPEFQPPIQLKLRVSES